MTRKKAKAKVTLHTRSVAICRDLRHAWDFDRNHGGEFDDGGFWREIPCFRCPVVKYQELDDYGHITKSNLKYPKEGYLVRGGRMTANELAAIRLYHQAPNQYIVIEEKS